MDQYIMDIITAHAYNFKDGSFLTWGWVILTILAFSLIPGALILKAVMAARTRRVFEETQPAIDAGIRELKITSSRAESMLERVRKGSYTTRPDLVEAYEEFTCKKCFRPTKVRRVRFETVYCFHCNAILLADPFDGTQSYRTQASMLQPRLMNSTQAMQAQAKKDERIIKDMNDRDREDEDLRRRMMANDALAMPTSMVPPTVYDPGPSYSAPSYDPGPSSQPDCGSQDSGSSFDSGSCSDSSSSF